MNGYLVFSLCLVIVHKKGYAFLDLKTQYLSIGVQNVVSEWGVKPICYSLLIKILDSKF